MQTKQTKYTLRARPSIGLNEAVVWTADVWQTVKGARYDLARNGVNWGEGLTSEQVAEAIAYDQRSNKQRKAIAQKLLAA
jgi:hypothetical protein